MTAQRDTFPAAAAAASAAGRGNGSSPACPLCCTPDARLQENIRTAELAAMAGKMLGWSVKPEFKGIETIGYFHCNHCDLRFFSPAVTGSEEFYKQFQQFDWHFRKHKQEYDFSRQFIKPVDRVLEIGCGKGVFAKQISTKNYVGLEFSGDAIRLAAFEGVKVLKQPIQDHATANAVSYDFVCAFQVLEHVADTRSFIASSLACLKPGGLLVFSVPANDSFLDIVTNAVTNLPPYHVTRWSDRCLSNIASLFGLELIVIEHEPMASRHKKLYASALITAALETTLGMPRRVVNRSLGHRIAANVGRAGAGFLSSGLRHQWVVPRGPAVTAVYRKN